jgi:uncharacterized membrane protein
MAAIAAYFATLVSFVGLDMVWLGLMVDRIYRPAIGDALAPGVNLPAALAFYLLFPVGLTIFAILPALKAHAISDAALYGSLFGFFAYATYDLSNQATLRAWSTQLSLIDMGWGFVLSGLAASFGYFVAQRFS